MDNNVSAVEQCAKPRSAKFSDRRGNEWNGKGKQLDWLQAAIASGHLLNEFKLKPAKVKCAGSSAVIGGVRAVP